MKIKMKTIALFMPPLLALAAPAWSKQPIKSQIQFIVEHPLKTVEGNVTRMSISDMEYTQDGGFQLKQPFTITIRYQDMKTGNGNRDSHMMEVLGYPDHTSVMARITEARASDSILNVSGLLTINGVSQAFRTRASLKELPDGPQIAGSTIIRLSDFQIEPPSLLGMSVEDTVTIRYSFRLPK